MSNFDVNSQDGFNAALRAQAEKPAASAEPESAPVDPSTQSADEIVRGILSPGNAPDLRDGLTVTERQPAEPVSAEVERYVEKAKQEMAAEDSHVASMRNELAVRRFAEIWNDEAASDRERIAAALELRQQAPDIYNEYVEGLDADAIAESVAFDPMSDIDEEFPEGLPGQMLAAEVQNASHIQRAFEYKMAAQILQEKAMKQRADAVTEVYQREGLADTQFEARWLQDKNELTGLGYDPDSMAAAELKTALEGLSAARAEYVHGLRTAAFHQSFFQGDDPSDIQSGLEVLGANGYQPVQPRPTFSPIPSDFAERVVARANKESKPTTKGEFRNRIVAAGTPRLLDGLTGPDGRPIHVDDVTGARERRQRELEERRAADRGLLR